MIRVLAFECEFCGKLNKSRKITARHERACMKNPEGQNCLKCYYHYTDIDYVNRCKLDEKKCSIVKSSSCQTYKRWDFDKTKE